MEAIEAECRTKWELMLELQPQSVLTETEISMIHQKKTLICFYGQVDCKDAFDRLGADICICDGLSPILLFQMMGTEENRDEQRS